MARVQYKTVMNLLWEQGDFATREYLRGSDSGLKSVRLASLFRVAVDAGNDQSALRYLELVFHAVADDSFLPICSRDCSDDGRMFYDSAGALVGETNREVVINQALRAGEFLAFLPVGKANFPGTEELILRTIAVAWREARDEETSKKCFQFLANRNRVIAGDDEEERDRLLRAVKEATNKAFPIERLERAFFSLVPKPDELLGFRDALLAHVLANGWLRGERSFLEKAQLIHTAIAARQTDQVTES